jgi:acetate CoA/acetoacetate CoA-transferase alpha subunit
MVDKLIDMARAVAVVGDGATIAVGGFMGCGNPHRIVSAIVEAGVKDLTLICNDASTPGYGVAKLVEHKLVKRLIASHVGLNPEVAIQMRSGEIEVELVPQGTLAERIRAAGAGLGAVVTPTGVGTVVAEGKATIEIDGVTYLVEKPLRADIALLNGYLVDPRGNIWYKGATRNFNPLMAAAAAIVIVEADHLVALGDIPPEDIVTPGVLVTHIVQGGAQ